ncbi:acyl-CoA synthetase [Actinocorallia sp. API 0066]|uniref:acyl-CoA synthetase n=1 Tax=Actinocorallia sp. API 0066 TaxID=2896846 RepID=UPI001E654042|nr:acyl-CoA synthetase [Actinocorallia sp. API 0066]MCD0447984.1 acyl-CoA synthetase [Actinocorallia sp. API 0066]
MTALQWPARYEAPADLAAIEAVPLAERNLPETTYHVLERAAELWPDRTAVAVLPNADDWKAHTSVTFGRLRAEVNAVANALHELGLRRRGTVGLLSPNCRELLAATIAAQTAGIAVPVNPGMSPEHIRELLVRTGARILIAAGPELDPAAWRVALGLARGGTVDAVLALRPTGATGRPPSPPLVDGALVAYLDERSTIRTDRFTGTPPTAADLAAIFHTGGTTGLPKLAAHTHANQVVNAWMVAANTTLDQHSVAFAGLPLFHVNALIVTLLAPLLRGHQVVWAGPDGYRDAQLYPRFWEIVEHFQVATMSAVPTVYQVLARVPVDADISSMRAAAVGAAALPPAVRDAFVGNTGIPLIEGYGLTEATCASVRGFLRHPRPGSIGQRMPYQQVKIVRVEPDGTWTDLPAGEVGLLVIKGPTVFPGYVTGHDAQGPVLDGQGRLVDGWLDTGDLARIDQDGYVHLTGRAKDLIIRGGHNIDPAMIEDVLLAHPAVTGAAAVGRPDHHAGEVPVAFVTLVPAATVTGADLKVWAARHVADRAAAPKAVTIRDSLPVTAIGKPHKPTLRAEAARDALSGALEGLPHIDAVEAVVEDGSPVVIVHTGEDVDQAAVRSALNVYDVEWRLRVGADGPVAGRNT